MSLMTLAYFLIFNLLIPTVHADEMPSETIDCIAAKFDINISHKSSPLGLFSRKLSVNKDKCIISIQHEKYKYLKNSWEVDVCRSPVHIKKMGRRTKVIKRDHNCRDKGKGSFCSHYACIKNKIQDDGLIFAKGEKEDLGSEHGKAYCTYLLLEHYLGGNTVFNSKDRHFEIYKTSAEQVVPVPKEKDSTTISF